MMINFILEEHLGDDTDLQIYHDGANSCLSDHGTGDLRLSGNVV